MQYLGKNGCILSGLYAYYGIQALVKLFILITVSTLFIEIILFNEFKKNFKMYIETFCFRLTEVFRKIKDPKVIEINSTSKPEEVVDIIVPYIDKLKNIGEVMK